MTRSFTAAVAASVLTALVATTAVLAAEQQPAPQPRQDTMDGHRAMMGQMSPEQRAQMARMMEDCNRMMAGMGSQPTTPGADAPSAPIPDRPHP